MSLFEQPGRRRPNRLAWIASILLLAVGAGLWAQPAGPAGDTAGDGTAAVDNATPPPAAGLSVDPVTGDLPSVLDLFRTSPVINGILGMLSVTALLLFLYFLVTISAASMAPPTFVDDVTKLVLNQQYREAADLCRSRHGIFIASIIQRCVENADKEHSVILDIVDNEGKRRADILWNRISYLADVSNVAPMLGLFGTVYGMMRSFYTAKFQSLSASSGALTDGIAQAMATTMFGLIVAILALGFHAMIRARVTRSLAECEHAVHTIADHLKRHKV